MRAGARRAGSSSWHRTRPRIGRTGPPRDVRLLVGHPDRHRPVDVAGAPPREAPREEVRGSHPSTRPPRRRCAGSSANRAGVSKMNVRSQPARPKLAMTWRRGPTRRTPSTSAVLRFVIPNVRVWTSQASVNPSRAAGSSDSTIRSFASSPPEPRRARMWATCVRAPVAAPCRSPPACPRRRAGRGRAYGSRTAGRAARRPPRALELGGRSAGLGRVLEAGREPDGARVEPRLQLARHRPQLVGRGRPSCRDKEPQVAERHQRRDVDRGARRSSAAR